MKDVLRAACLMAAALVAAAQTQIDLRNQSKNVDFSGAASTKPFRLGTQLPATCALGEAFFKTDAPAGENLYACTASNVWTLQSGGNGLPDMAGQADKVLSTTGSAAEWRALGGDVGGSPQAVTVGKLQGRSVAATPPADGQVLRWSASASRWEPAPEPAAVENYSQTFTDQTTVTITGAAHGFGTAKLIVDCYDSSSPSVRLTPSSVSVNTTSYDVTVVFATAQSGRCVINGSGAAFAALTSASNTFASGTTQTFQGALIATGAGRTAPVMAGTALPSTCVPGDQFFRTSAAAGQNLYFCTGANVWTQMAGGQVASVFGRTGAVTAASGDYSFSQISGSVTNAQLAAGVDATKIGAGTVSNAIFGYLANLSGDAQTQLNNKAPANHSHQAAGDVSGDLGALVVTGLQGRGVSSTAPADGQGLVWSSAASAWQPGTVGSGGGAGMASQLNDLAVGRTNSTVLTIGAACSTATPCNVRFGNTAYSFTRSCTATISGGTGTAYMYVASGGTLTIGHNVTLAASAGCLAQPSITNFPPDAIPLWTWTAASGTWDAAGGHDFRALLSTKNVSAGTGVATLESGGRTVVSVDTATVPAYVSAAAALDFPSIPSGACSADQTLTVYGAVSGDAVAPGWPAVLESGLIGLMRVSAADTVAVRLCNLSGAAVDPASRTYRATIIRSF
ncbi:MAG: hypothetical protein ABSD27_04990 [Bryobacteraceae bacterium]